MPPRRSPIRRALLPCLVLAVVAWAPRLAHAQLTSPGALSQAHADLEGDDHCSDCHQAGDQVRNELCLDCHKDLAKRISTKAGLHGINYARKECTDCHSEHIGRKTKLIRWPGGSMEQLDHDDTGWTLEGKHVGPKCLDCHKKTQPSGKPSFLGLSKACNTCHKDPHAGRFGKTCTSCHDQVDWKKWDQAKFDHAKTKYPLTGKHVTVECEKCHGKTPQWTGIKFSTCDTCHQDPHKGAFTPQACDACHTTADWHDKKADEQIAGRKHPRLSLANGHAKVECKTCHDKGNAKLPSKGKTCVACHPVVHEAKFGKGCEKCHASIVWQPLPESVGRDAHDQTPYPLEGQHQQVKCAACHPAKLAPQQRYRELKYDTCQRCHEDVHKGELARYGECTACHSLVDGFVPTKFGVDQHDATAMPLAGGHRATPCRDCHKSAPPRTEFKVAQRACADCHQTPHGDQFADQGGCDTCHDVVDWRAAAARIDHATWPLTGPHAAAACSSCHGDDSTGTPATYRGTPRDCEGCHEDEHAGQFRLAEPVKACTTCHAGSSFAIASFDHPAQSQFALEGKHAAVDCAQCHAKATLASGVEATRYRLGYRACKDCHASPHRDAATNVAVLDCSSCHVVADWALAATGGVKGFDHDGTGFPLRSAHADAACAECHTIKETPPTTCTGCHDDPHERRMDGTCEECHAPTTWKDTEVLERHRLTRMPLTGRHATLLCTDCHVRQQEQQYERLPTDCYACHAKDYPDSADRHPNHEDPNRGSFGRDCQRCHTTVGWSPAVLDAPLAKLAATDLAHDDVFVLTTGAHRDADCASCHVGKRATARVRCDGCHGSRDLRAAHGGKSPGKGAARCLSCHPRGVAR